MATGTPTLDTSAFKTVWTESFDTSLGSMNHYWGHVWVHDGEVQLTAAASDGYQVNSGFMQSPSGASADQGFGLYSVTMAIDPNEGPGAFACLWPASDTWPGPELDLIEKQGSGSNTNGYSTIHWKAADGSDAYQTFMLTGVDVSLVHTYAMDWESDHITMYVDGVQAWTTTQHVPQDYAHGGENAAFGGGMQSSWAAGQQNGDNNSHFYAMSYAAPVVGATTTPTTTTPPTVVSSPPTPVAHAPATLAAGSGSDSLVLKLSEDAYNGDAQYTVKVDGVQVGGTFTAAALHGAGDDTLTLSGTWGSGAHKVTVNFLNDAWGGTATTDRNLHVDAISYNGKAASIASGAGDLMSAGPVDFSIAATTTTTTTTTTTGLPSPANGGILVQGTAVAEQLFGTAGDDVILGGKGNDGLTGGKGADYFVFAQGDGPDWLNDFGNGADHLLLQGVAASTVTTKVTSYYGTGGLDVHYGTAGDSVFLAGVWKLGAADIVFA